MKKIILAICLLVFSYVLSAQKIELLASGTKTSLRGLSAVTDKIIWASGSKGTVARSIDSGKTWKWIVVKGFETRDFRDIEAFDAATCIGCGACVAACKNASAMLFVSAKVSQFALLPQGQPERYNRVQAMVAQMDAEGFGNCTNTGACEAECPKEISLTNIGRMNNDYLSAKLFREEHVHES